MTETVQKLVEFISHYSSGTDSFEKILVQGYAILFLIIL